MVSRDFKFPERLANAPRIPLNKSSISSGCGPDLATFATDVEEFLEENVSKQHENPVSRGHTMPVSALRC